MTHDQLDQRVNELFRRERWAEARRLLESAQKADPENHWILTQLGVTFYEKRQYAKALRLFRKSFKILPDCPLTLWHLAGALDAMGKTTKVVRIYTWLLESNASPQEDPCWESKAWTESLKTDCLYSLGTCYDRLGKKRAAESCYRRYLHLLSIGIEGLYPSDDVLRRIRSLHAANGNDEVRRELRKAIQATLAPKGSKKSRAVVKG